MRERNRPSTRRPEARYASSLFLSFARSSLGSLPMVNTLMRMAWVVK